MANFNEMDLETIKKRSVHGIVALTSRTFILSIISQIASIIIFTALSRSDVGIYVVVIAIQRVISFFTDFGLGAAIVQKKDTPTESDLSTIFTIQTIVTGIIFLTVLIFKDIIGGFFNLDASGSILLVSLIFTVFVSSFKTIPSILLERKIQFHKLIIPQIVESLVFNILLVILLLGKVGIASFTFAFLLSSLSGLPFYYLISPWKIKFGIHKESLSHLRFGIAFQAKNVLATLKDDMLTVFLSKFLTLSDIGYIGFAQRNSFFAYRYVVDSITKVSFSTYSRLQHDLNLLKSSIEKSLFFVSAAMSPIMIGLIVIMPYIVKYFPKWHDKWELALLSFTFFSLNALISSFSGILVNVLDSTGRVKTTLKLMVIWTTLTWVLTALLIYLFKYNGVAIASFLVTLTIFYTVRLVSKIVKFSFFGSISKPLIAACIMGFAVYFLALEYAVNLIWLIPIIALGGIIYTAIIYFLAKEQLIEALKLLIKKYETKN